MNGITKRKLRKLNKFLLKQELEYTNDLINGTRRG